MNDFSEIKLFVATPMYGGSCTTVYLQGMLDLFSACAKYNIPICFHEITDEAIISKARNRCAHAFLESDFTHFLFIDADIGFMAKDALTLLRFQNLDKEKKYDVLAGPYPKKLISWKKVKKAVEKGLVKDPKELKNYVGDYTFLAPVDTPLPLSSPGEVNEIGTGFMMIPRRTFENFKRAYPEQTYKAGDQEIFAFFDTFIDPQSKRFLSEDSMFCRYVKKMGGKVWLAPQLNLSHQGMYTFQGSLSHIAAIGMSPADP